MKEKRSSNDLQRLRVREEPFASGSISFKEIEHDSGKWKVVGFYNLNLRDLSRAIFKQLLDEEFHSIKINGIKFKKTWKENEIYTELADSISSEKLASIFL